MESSRHLSPGFAPPMFMTPSTALLIMSLKTAASMPSAPAAAEAGADVGALCEKLYGELPHAREAFEKALREQDIAFDEPLPMPPAGVHRLEKQSLRSAGGVEIRVPVSVYRDENALEFIHNPDGTTSLLIKNVLV